MASHSFNEPKIWYDTAAIASAATFKPTFQGFFYLYVFWGKWRWCSRGQMKRSWAGLSRTQPQQSAEGFYAAMKENTNSISPYEAKERQAKELLLCKEKREMPVKCTDKLKRLKTPELHWKKKAHVQSDLLFRGKNPPSHFICDTGESRYEPGALMKRAEYPANTLTGPRWLLGNKAKWLLSDLVCLSTAAPHLWLWALLLSG